MALCLTENTSVFFTFVLQYGRDINSVSFVLQCVDRFVIIIIIIIIIDDVVAVSIRLWVIQVYGDLRHVRASCRAAILSCRGC